MYRLTQRLRNIFLIHEVIAIIAVSIKQTFGKYQDKCMQDFCVVFTLYILLVIKSHCTMDNDIIKSYTV